MQLRKYLRVIVVSMSLAIVITGRSRAEDPADSIKPTITATKISGEIRLSGKLDDPQWVSARPVELNYEVTPGENTPASQQTTVRILYNDQRIYFGFDCKDTDPSEIRAHVTDRDKAFDDDWVMVLLDTYGDYQRSYELVVNPYGIQGDLLRTGNNEDVSFDAVWESAAAIYAAGWTAEISIPFKSMRFPSKPEQRWVVEFLRNYPRASRVQISWVKVDRNNPCLPCQVGTIEGIKDVQAAASSVDLLPYVLGQQSGSLDDQSNPESKFENGKVAGRVGGGLRYAPTPDFAVEGVINPDFSQVESDATQISVNSNFALFYPEKRPFFLLGADMFQNQTQTFYSRTINNPLGAARVIGKSGSLSFAYLAASDRNTPFIVPGEETSDYIATDLKSVSNIARVRYDFGKENYLGGTVNTRNTGSIAYNYLWGVDWNYKFWENYYFSGEVFYASTREVNDTSYLSDSRAFGTTGHDATFNGEKFDGTSTNMTFQKSARDYSFSLQYLDRGPTFQAQDGFVPNNNLRTGIFQQQYTFYPNSSLIDQWSLSLNTGLHFNYDGVRKEKWALPNLYAQFKGQTSINILYFAVNDELYHSVQFDRINRGEVTVNSRPASFLTLSLDGSFGRFIKRTDPVDMGRGHNISLSALVRLTSQLEIDLSYTRARLSSLATGELFYDGYIARSTGIFQFTKEIFLRVIGQYDEFNKKIDVYPLISYKLNPYTIFYTGSTYSLSDFGEPYGVRTMIYQYFIKLQYLIQS
jgi:hypothetical protein